MFINPYSLLQRIIRLEKFKHKLLQKPPNALFHRLLHTQETLMKQLRQQLTTQSPTIHTQLTPLVGVWQQHCKTTISIIRDLQLSCEKFFYTESACYTKAGKKQQTLLKRYSRST